MNNDFESLLGNIVYDKDNRRHLVIAVGGITVTLGGFCSMPKEGFFDRFSTSPWDNSEVFEFTNMLRDDGKARFDLTEIYLFGSGRIPYEDIEEVTSIDEYIFIKTNIRSKSIGEREFTIKPNEMNSISWKKFKDKEIAKRFYTEVLKKTRTKTIRDYRARIGGCDIKEVKTSDSISTLLTAINEGKFVANSNTFNALSSLRYVEYKGETIILSKIGVDLLRSSIEYKGNCN